MMRTGMLSITILVLGAAATAHAQPGAGADAPAAAPPPAAASPAPSSVPAGVLEDANSGRAWLSPTALMPPGGTWSFNNYELFFVGGSYAFTDNFQLSGTTMIPLTSDQPLFMLLSAKLGLQALERLHIAVQASTILASISDMNGGGLLLGGVATLCLDPDCHSLLNGYVGAGFSREDRASVVPMVLSAAFVQRLSRRIKLVLEADSGLIVGDINEVSRGVLGWYGVRFTSRNIGVDLGLVRPFCADCDMDVLPLGFPWVTFSYRGI